MATHSNGISALHPETARYRLSAWLLAHKLRASMVDPERNPLSGLNGDGHEGHASELDGYVAAPPT